jgi:hypothetical protein
MTRKAPSDRRLPDSVDFYRERIVPPLVPGFNRPTADFDLSDDKCRLDCRTGWADP